MVRRALLLYCPAALQRHPYGCAFVLLWAVSVVSKESDGDGQIRVGSHTKPNTEPNKFLQRALYPRSWAEPGVCCFPSFSADGGVAVWLMAPLLYVPAS